MLDFIKIFILVSIGCCMAQAYANAATINHININPDNIVIDSVQNIKTKVVSDDEIILTLKDTTAAKDFKIYHNQAELNNILVKQNKNNTQITIKAPNASKMQIAGTDKTTGGFNYLWLLSAASLFLLRRKHKPEPVIKNFAKYNHNVDYILNAKIKKHQEEKIKIAA